MENIEPEVFKKICEKISLIEREEQIKIFYAVESGSRAWGFSSIDSDYDVCFLYVHSRDWYLSLWDRRDVIERPIEEDLDLSGWDIKKALWLFWKSNPPFLEWLQSPLLYLEEFTTIGKIRKLAPLLFSPKSCLYHYLHMAEGNFREYLQGEIVKSKKYFYVLRPVLACLWIEKYNNMPPMEFQALLDDLVPESPLRREILKLLERKKSGEELTREPRIKSLNDFLEEKIIHLKGYAQNAPVRGPIEMKVLDGFFWICWKRLG